MKTSSALWYRWALALPMVMILVMSLALPVQAASFDADARVGADEVIDDDVFLEGDQVEMAGTIHGNLVAMGNVITISGTVNGDVFAFGNVIVIAESGVIHGNLFTGGQQVQMNGSVAGSMAGGASSLSMGKNASTGLNLYYGGYALTTASDSQIGRSLYAGVYQAVLDGTVDQDVNIGAGAVELNGKVSGDVSLDVGSSEGETFTSFWMPAGAPTAIKPGLRISDEAEIGGSLTYTSPQQQADAIQAQPQGGVVFQTPVPEEAARSAAPDSSVRRVTIMTPFLRWVLKFFQRMLTLLILAGLAVWLLPHSLKKSADKAAQKLLPSAGMGFVSLIVGYAGAFIAGVMITGVGILMAVLTLGALSRVIFGIGLSSLALAFAIFMLLVNYGSKLVVAYLVGTRLLAQILPNVRNQAVWGTLLGVVVYVLVRSIPFVGWLIGLAVTVIGLGAMWLVFQDWRNGRRPAGVVTIVEPLPEA